MPKIGIVTDSTCDLGPEWFAERDVVMVPLKVLFGDTTYLDWIDLTNDEFYAKLAASPVLPKTSQPSPADFAEAYGRLAAEGATEIVSIHLSSKLSGTVESAVIAAAEAPIPVRVVDSLSVNMGTGNAVDAAVTARDAGGDADEVERAARYVCERGRIFFALDTLDYLVKGGRAGKAQGLAASLLNIKPVLMVNAEGIIEPYRKVKGTKKAIAEIVHGGESLGKGKIRASLLHSQAPELVEELRAALAASKREFEILHIVNVGAVIGTYAGPGAVGAAFYPAE